jgi:predicted transcriptional regulator
VTRLIQLLRAHGLVAKIPRTRRYRITTQGELLMSAAIKVKELYLPKEIRESA